MQFTKFGLTLCNNRSGPNEPVVEGVAFRFLKGLHGLQQSCLFRLIIRTIQELGRSIMAFVVGCALCERQRPASKTSFMDDTKAKR